ISSPVRRLRGGNPVPNHQAQNNSSTFFQPLASEPRLSALRSIQLLTNYSPASLIDGSGKLNEA
ncbi:MAG: hypothetical protein AAB225_31645, partial [Acidobacteriota bacterium]